MVVVPLIVLLFQHVVFELFPWHFLLKEAIFDCHFQFSSWQAEQSHIVKRILDVDTAIDEPARPTFFRQMSLASPKSSSFAQPECSSTAVFLKMKVASLQNWSVHVESSSAGHRS